ncbi:MAG TPA: glycosyltransferase family 9 protein [Steroidobacteraceae bacterium]|nr:glycosyltransferase family 9 protein [Steroidobacteraceae bacterium]
MGDMVLTTPLIRALALRFGQPVDIMSSGDWTRPLLEQQSGVGRMHLITSRRRPYPLNPPQWRLVADLRRRGPGPVWLCDENPAARALLRRAGYGPSEIVAATDHPFEPGEHVVDRWLRMAAQTPRTFASLPAAEIDFASLRTPRLTVTPAARDDLESWLESRGLTGRALVLVQPGNKRTMRRFGSRRRATNVKYWPEERWAGVIDGILRRLPDAAVLLLGVPVEAALNADILRHVNVPGAHNVAGEVPIPRLLALQERAVGMVSVDTGPAHSAAALDCPLVVLFATADPREIGPRSHGSPVMILGGRRDSLLPTTVDEVLAAWDQIERARPIDSPGNRAGPLTA